MSFRAGALLFVDVILRVPPLFLIDELLRIGLGFTGQSDSVITSNDTTTLFNFTQTLEEELTSKTSSYDAKFYAYCALTLLKLAASGIGCIAALCVFLLSTHHLVVVYNYLTTVAIVFLSYWSNINMTRTFLATAEQESYILEDVMALNFTALTSPESPGFTVFKTYLLQSLLSFIFVYIHVGPRHYFVQKILPLAFMGPSFIAILPLPSYILQHSPVFAALLPLALVNFTLWYSAITVAQTLHNGYVYSREVVSSFGLSALFEAEWTRLNVPIVLRTFWLLRVLEQAGVLVMVHYQQAIPNIPLLAFASVLSMCKSLLISGCETLTALLGMTSIVSYLCHYVGSFFQWILLTEDDDDKSMGTVSAILFYILALQTGLTSLEPEKRFIRLGRNFCLLFTALLHFIHNIVNPLLMSLSASHNPSLHRHLRALLVCGFLILFPSSLLIYLWSQHATSTWLLAVSAFSIEVIVKVLVSLMIYVLFLVDAYRSTFWEKLDDYVYYIRAFGNTVEFCFGIFLFFNGAWILIFESGGAIRAVMMCIHAYFNIWCEAKAGWSVFMKRRTAVNKINSLPEATEEQLRTLDDVCAICYQEMKTAKITSCNHFFHGVCLRKWLYVQDRCPLCHDILYKVEAEPAEEQQEVPGEEHIENFIREENNFFYDQR